MVNRTQEGHIEVIAGCMFAGKTEELLRRLRRAEIAGQDIIVFTPSIDERYGQETIGSHNGQKWNANVIETDESGVEELVDRGKEYDVVAVDEFNFFTDEFIHAVQELADTNTRVIVSGLDQTFRGEPFNPVNHAMAVAEDVEKLTAICEQCGGDATRPQRLVDGEPAPADAPTVQVGGEESYEARCRNCHELK